jgi:hypothetical protein
VVGLDFREGSDRQTASIGQFPAGFGASNTPTRFGLQQVANLFKVR